MQVHRSFELLLSTKQLADVTVRDMARSTPFHFVILLLDATNEAAEKESLHNPRHNQSAITFALMLLKSVVK
jgi:DNA repair protein RadC